MSQRSPIESLIHAEQWSPARIRIRAALKDEPDSHWLLTRLGLTCYEQRKYGVALRYHDQALALAPNCPLALWDKAGALQMLGRHAEALELYRRLVRRRVTSIARGPCGEGLAWARGFVADCYLRMADSFEALGKSPDSLRSFEKHLEMRGPGCHSIYPLRSLRRRHRLA